MIELFTAIQTAFKANAFLSQNFPNGLEAIEGADSELLPNCLVIGTGGSSQYSTPATDGIVVTDTCYLQFNVRATSASFVYTALSNLRKSLDHQPLAMEGLMDSRQSMVPKVIKEDERVYCGTTEYKFMVGFGIT